MTEETGDDPVDDLYGMRCHDHGEWTLEAHCNGGFDFSLGLCDPCDEGTGWEIYYELI